MEPGAGFVAQDAGGPSLERRRLLGLLGLAALGFGPAPLAYAQRPGPPPRGKNRRDLVTPVEGVVPAGGNEPANSRAVSTGSQTASRDALREGPLAKLVAMAEQSEQALAEIADYTAVFTRKELVKRRLVEQKMEM
ncbi:MAG: hypothetical protein ACKOJF_18435, partial [Planctomycetaceae bacterium]